MSSKPVDRLGQKSLTKIFCNNWLHLQAPVDKNKLVVKLK